MAPSVERWLSTTPACVRLRAANQKSRRAVLLSLSRWAAAVERALRLSGCGNRGVRCALRAQPACTVASTRLRLHYLIGWMCRCASRDGRAPHASAHGWRPSAHRAREVGQPCRSLDERRASPSHAPAGCPMTSADSLICAAKGCRTHHALRHHPTPETCHLPPHTAPRRDTACTPLRRRGGRPLSLLSFARRCAGSSWRDRVAASVCVCDRPTDETRAAPAWARPHRRALVAMRLRRSGRRRALRRRAYISCPC